MSRRHAPPFADPWRLDRRTLLKLGVGVAGAAALGELGLPRAARADGPPPTPITFTPFTQDLIVPPVLKPVAPFKTTVPVTGPAAYYLVHMRKGLAEIIPGVQTEILGYEGLYPGPSIVGRAGRADVVRFVNQLGFETSIHQHGGHNPAAFDGYPSAFIEPNFVSEKKTPLALKDYLYPNQPAGGDPNENPSTAWYHDHALDATGPNVYAGLAGFYPCTDALEDGLGAQARLPASRFDVGLALQDRRFNADGSLFYNPFSHDGFLGDVFVVNGKAQPRFHVQPRRYRLRFLNGSNARVYMLRLSSGAPFLQIGLDAWLLPRAVLRDQLLLGMATRMDVVVDFRNAPKEVYLMNLIDQVDGRGPGGTSAAPQLTAPGTPLMKFVVDQPLSGEKDATVAPGDALRPHTPIRPEEIATTRTWEFVRSQGAWQINGQFYDPDRIDATIEVGTAERWIIKNGGGGWWHPIHMHLEAHQLVSFNGVPVPPDQWTKRDTTLLGPGDQAEVFIRFRDHKGILVFHCHNIEHEDMRMMAQFEVV